eukprot:gene16514-biopygen9324
MAVQAITMLRERAARRPMPEDPPGWAFDTCDHWTCPRVRPGPATRGQHWPDSSSPAPAGRMTMQTARRQCDGFGAAPRQYVGRSGHTRSICIDVVSHPDSLVEHSSRLSGVPASQLRGCKQCNPSCASGC